MLDEFDVANDVELANLEKAEASIDQFIERRARENKAAREAEAMYAESVRRFYAQVHYDNAQRWLDYHDRQLAAHQATLEGICRHHAEQREKYARLLGQTVPGDPGYPGETPPTEAA